MHHLQTLFVDRGRWSLKCHCGDEINGAGNVDAALRSLERHVDASLRAAQRAKVRQGR